MTPLLLLKRAICAIGLGPGLVEFCGVCGRTTDLVWWSPDDLWREVTGEQHGGGVRCTRCFDREAYRRGLLLRWRPAVEHRRGPDGWTP